MTTSARENAIIALEQFKAVIQSKDFLLLDTETTSLEDGEICEICIMDSASNVLFNSLLKTKEPIPDEATQIHGIDDDMVEDAPTWPQVVDQIKKILSGRSVVVYNAVYDRKMMHKTQERWEGEKIEWKEICDFHCAMEAYAAYYGEWNSYRGSFKWQSLRNAAKHLNIPRVSEHRAYGDCWTTLVVCRTMIGLSLDVPF